MNRVFRLAVLLFSTSALFSCGEINDSTTILEIEPPNIVQGKALKGLSKQKIDVSNDFETIRSSTRTMAWAYYTDQTTGQANERWYISLSVVFPLVSMASIHL